MSSLPLSCFICRRAACAFARASAARRRAAAAQAAAKKKEEADAKKKEKEEAAAAKKAEADAKKKEAAKGKKRAARLKGAKARFPTKPLQVSGRVGGFESADEAAALAAKHAAATAWLDELFGAGAHEGFALTAETLEVHSIALLHFTP